MTRTGNQRRAAAALIAIAGSLWTSAAVAAPVIEASLSADSIALGEQAVYSVTVTGHAGGQIVPPNFGELRVFGPQTSHQSVMHLGPHGQTVRSSVVYSWTVEAPREGRFRIGAAELRVGSESYRTEPMELTCEGQLNARQQNPRRARPDPFDPFNFDPLADDPFDAFGRIDELLRVQPPRGRAENDVFLRAVVDKAEPYLGEQVTLSLYLFASAGVDAVQTLSFPKLDGFWAEDVESPSQLTPEVRMVNGRQYYAYLLRRRALFPLRSGDLVIDPVEGQIDMGLSMFRGMRNEVVKRRSEPVKISVKPLPAAGRPAKFDGAHVGQFFLSAKVSQSVVPAGQPAQVRLTLEGAGNVKGAKVPRLSLPEGLKTYDPTVTDKVKVAGTRYGGTKTIEYVVVPERTGTFSIPPVEFHFFDPRKQQYQVARTEPIELTVEAGAPVAAGSPAATAPVASNVLSTGVRPIRTTTDLAALPAVLIWNRPYFWPLTGGPLLLLAFAWSGAALAGLLRRRDPQKLRTRRAKGTAAKRLQQARELLDRRDAGAFHAEVSRSLTTFVADRMGLAPHGLTRDELRNALIEKGCPQAESELLVALLDECEHARYAPMPSQGAQLERVLDDARRVIDALDSARGRRSA